MKSIYLYMESIQSPNMERVNIFKNQHVDIVLKKDQPSGKLTRGIVKDILTSKPKHTRGVKVRLHSGQVGRVQKILIQLKKFNTIYLKKFNKKELDFVDFTNPKGKYHSIYYDDIFCGLTGYVSIKDALSKDANFYQIIILPEYRGLDILEIAAKLLMMKYRLNTIESNIDEANVRSIKSHKRAGFTQRDDGLWVLRK